MTANALEALLERWAEAYRLTPAESASIHAAVLTRSASDSPAETHVVDDEWLWKLLRPVTELLDGPHRLHDTLMRGYA
jgi:hypothetical protein